MKFEIRDSFALSPEALWTELFDPENEAKLAQLAGANREVVAQTVEGDRTTRHVRIHTSHPQMAQLAKLLGGDSVSFDQHFVLDAATRRCTWRYETPAGDRVRIAGTWRVEPHAEGAERIVEGDVKVSIPLVGGTLEGRIVQSIRDTFAKGTAWRKARLRQPS
jgi:hypothetical protein